MQISNISRYVFPFFREIIVLLLGKIVHLTNYFRTIIGALLCSIFTKKLSLYFCSQAISYKCFSHVFVFELEII